MKEESRFKYEPDKSIIYDSVTDDDICNCYDEKYVELLIRLLNKHYERSLSS